MSFLDLELADSYDSGFGDFDVVKDFYSPVLSESRNYDRVAGYFSSRVFASAARGVAGLVRNGGKMRLITSHAFTASDTKTIQDYFGSETFATELIEDFVGSYKELGNLSNTIAKNHVAAMCWMLREGILEIKVVVPDSADLTSIDSEDWDKFHPKFGIFYDEAGNKIAFSGSVNETAGAWRRNIENFDVFMSWHPGESERRIEPKIKQFERMWAGNVPGQWKTIELPSAVKDKIIQDYAPTDFPKDLEVIEPPFLNGLRSYQKAAVNSWIDGNCRGILEMATGTGKTKTARACISYAQSIGSLLTVVIVPYQHIGNQWAKELEDLNPISTGKDWRKHIADAASQVAFGRRKNLTIVAVKNTAASNDFTALIHDISSDFSNVLLVGDEVHWLGARGFQNSLTEDANFRLGLSATPNRYFDEAGTEILFNYFGQPTYTLTIGDALKIVDERGMPILCPYVYKPIAVPLSKDEFDRYLELTRKIGMLSGMNRDEADEERLQTFRNNRADIAKSAQSKIPAIEELLRSLTKPLEQCLIYCANFNQLNQVAKILADLNIPTQQITGLESASPSAHFNNVSEREHILKNFARGNLGVLLAIDCLDEGVDIPSARIGIILASSGNEKEFIQRRGRLMRPYATKNHAEIYDFCVLPVDPNDPLTSAHLVDVELRRIEQFAKDALNEDEITDFINRNKVRED